MSISPEGVPGKLIPWAEDVGTGWLDGMATDACGNVYIADYGATVIYRISPDGKQKDKIISGAGFSTPTSPTCSGARRRRLGSPSLYLPDGWNKGVLRCKSGSQAPQSLTPKRYALRLFLCVTLPFCSPPAQATRELSLWTQARHPTRSPQDTEPSEGDAGATEPSSLHAEVASEETPGSA